MWKDVELKVRVVDGTVTWAASAADLVGFGRTAREALFELEQTIEAAARGEQVGTSQAAAEYFGGNR